LQLSIGKLDYDNQNSTVELMDPQGPVHQRLLNKLILKTFFQQARTVAKFSLEIHSSKSQQILPMAPTIKQTSAASFTSLSLQTSRAFTLFQPFFKDQMPNL
jgi:hypothetical protein